MTTVHKILASLSGYLSQPNRTAPPYVTRTFFFLLTDSKLHRKTIFSDLAPYFGLLNPARALPLRDTSNMTCKTISDANPDIAGIGVSAPYYWPSHALNARIGCTCIWVTSPDIFVAVDDCEIPAVQVLSVDQAGSKNTLEKNP